jgi:hypothetical protein
MSDNGPQFPSFEKFATKCEFEHVSSSPEYPRSNGMAESVVKIVKKFSENSLHYLALLAHRATPSTKDTIARFDKITG